MMIKIKWYRENKTATWHKMRMEKKETRKNIQVTKGKYVEADSDLKGEIKCEWQIKIAIVSKSLKTETKESGEQQKSMNKKRNIMSQTMTTFPNWRDGAQSSGPVTHDVATMWWDNFTKKGSKPGGNGKKTTKKTVRNLPMFSTTKQEERKDDVPTKKE